MNQPINEPHRIYTYAVQKNSAEDNVLEAMGKIGTVVPLSTNTRGFVETEGLGTVIQDPLGPGQAQALADEDGRIYVITAVDQQSYLDAYARGRMFPDGDDEYDLVHKVALSFGVTHDSSIEILAVCRSQFIVEYSTVLIDPTD